MAKNQNLVLAGSFYDFFVAHFVKEHHSFDGFFLCNANVDLLERHWTVALVEVVETSLWVHPQEGCNVLVIGQSCTESNYSHEFRCLLNLSNGSSNDCFENWTSGIMQQVDLINDDQLYEVDVGSLA